MIVYTEGKRAFVIRIPEGMLDRIKVVADKDGRSMNKWIERALDQGLAMDEGRALIAPSIDTPPASVGPPGCRCPACADVDNGCNPAVYPCTCACHEKKESLQ